MAQMTIRCSEELHEALREAAYRTRVSMNALILGVLNGTYPPVTSGPARLYRAVESRRPAREADEGSFKELTVDRNV